MSTSSEDRLPTANVELCRGGTTVAGYPFPIVHYVPIGKTCPCGAVSYGNARPTSVVRIGYPR